MILRRLAGLWQIGFFTPNGKWECIYSQANVDMAYAMLHYLNGGNN